MTDRRQIKQYLLHIAVIAGLAILLKEFNVSAGKTSLVRIAAFYYPHRQAAIIGKKTRLEIADDGTILIPSPEASVNVALHLKEPDFVRKLTVVSITFRLLLSVLLFFAFVKDIKKLNAPEAQSPIH